MKLKISKLRVCLRKNKVKIVYEIVHDDRGMDLWSSEKAENAASWLGECGRELKKVLRGDMREEVGSFGEEIEVNVQTGEGIQCGREMLEELLKFEGAR